MNLVLDIETDRKQSKIWMVDSKFFDELEQRCIDKIEEGIYE